MELTKQQVIDKILSFNYVELAQWIKNRLQGNDKYFPIYLGHEPNLSGFLIDAFHHIKDQRFRDNFLEILGDLTNQFRGLSKSQIEERKEYIVELLILCGNIKQFDNKVSLLEIAVSGRFKGIMVDEESDLHVDLLTTLASYRIAGTCKFWLDQLMDEFNKRYANPAFYALKDYPDKLFEHIAVFIDKFKGKVELVLGIMSLVNEYGIKEIITRFRSIETNLTLEQKEALNEAFKKAEYQVPYKRKADKELLYKPSAPQPQYVAAPTPKYKPGATLKEKAAEIFKLMGYEVEMNREIAGHLIDIFLKKKKIIGNRYECWICICETGNRRVGKAAIDNLYPIREAVREELEKQPGICDDCQAIIISEKGFTKNAIEAAKVYGIELKTLDQLVLELNEFYAAQKQLILNFELLPQKDTDEVD